MDRTPTTRHAAEAGHLFKGRVASTTLVFPVRSSSRHSSVRPAAPLFPQTSRRVVRATRPAWVQELHPGRPKRGEKSAGMMHQIAWKVPWRALPERTRASERAKLGGSPLRLRARKSPWRARAGIPWLPNPARRRAAIVARNQPEMGVRRERAASRC